MTTITILPEETNSYRAVAGDKESTGRTAGEALDALASQLEDEESGTLVIVQNHKADFFFDAAQQERLTELMQLRKDGKLSPEEEGELEGLVTIELHGAQRRIEHLLQREKKVLPEDRLEALKMDLMGVAISTGHSPREILETLNHDVTMVPLKEAKIRRTLLEYLRRMARLRSRAARLRKIKDDSAQSSRLDKPER